jgi:hypothetical protein
MYCRVQLPGLNVGLNLNEKSPRTSEYVYAGDGIASGHCGVTVNRMTDERNGQFKCTLGFSDESKEAEGSTNVTVASKNLITFKVSCFPNCIGLWTFFFLTCRMIAEAAFGLCTLIGL